VIALNHPVIESAIALQYHLFIFIEKIECQNLQYSIFAIEIMVLWENIMLDFTLVIINVL